MIGWIFWNPDRMAFTLPVIHHPIAWYGILFALGFFLGYQLLFLLIHRWLAFHPLVSPQDFLDLRALRLSPSKKFAEIRSRFSPALKRALDNDQVGRRERETLARIVNGWIKEGSLPNVASSPLFFFCERYLDAKRWAVFLRRLELEKELGPALRTLKQLARLFCERLSVYVLIGIILGARLGHVIFYERFVDYLAHPMTILKTWEGGLASHGGIAGLFFAVFFFCQRYKKEYPWLSRRRLFDLLVLPALCIAVLVRLGNFVNQEILGTETNVAWAVIFGAPVDGGLIVPRHPAQLYEAFFYLVLFCIFLRFFPNRLFRLGLVSGITFGVVFCFRFFIEFVKCKQSYLVEGFPLTMGQLLSLPFIACGVWLIVTAMKKKRA